MRMSEEILKDLFTQDFSHFIVQIFGVWLHKALADYIYVLLLRLAMLAMAVKWSIFYTMHFKFEQRILI